MIELAKIFKISFLFLDSFALVSCVDFNSTENQMKVFDSELFRQTLFSIMLYLFWLVEPRGGFKCQTDVKTHSRDTHSKERIRLRWPR